MTVEVVDQRTNEIIQTFYPLEMDINDEENKKEIEQWARGWREEQKQRKVMTKE
ncbi:hypothetical protein ACI2OX_17000 [Bacillus sp. N9]